MFLLPLGSSCSACLGILLLSILCKCCNNISWYFCMSRPVFCTPSLSLTYWSLSQFNFSVPNKCLKNFMCDASSLCSSLFFSTQASLTNLMAALAVILWILKFVSLVICIPKCLFIMPFCLLYICSLSSESLYSLIYGILGFENLLIPVR